MLQERVANLLGVAGTDIPIEYIQRLMLPYRVRLAPLLKNVNIIKQITVGGQRIRFYSHQ